MDTNTLILRRILKEIVIIRKELVSTRKSQDTLFPPGANKKKAPRN